MTSTPDGGAPQALDAVLLRLRCPICLQAVHRAGRRVGCPSGHGFDLARQGYLNLAVGRRAGTGDTAAMVAARDEFLGRGHYRPIADALAAVAERKRAVGFVLDVAGGTGHYLATVLEVTGGGYGVCLDLSSAALRRAARAHPRAAAIGADAWQPLPLHDGVADVVLSVFGPRAPAEIARVLAPDGRLITVTPAADHLTELIEPLGLLGVDPDKQRRTATAFAQFSEKEHRTVRYRAELTRDDARAAAAMGPSAWHVPPDELTARAARMPEVVRVSVAVDVRVYGTG